MCGIVGFTGNHQAAPILLYGLSRLEYRGYDSAGLAVRDGEGAVAVTEGDKTEAERVFGASINTWAVNELVAAYPLVSCIVRQVIARSIILPSRFMTSTMYSTSS